MYDQKAIEEKLRTSGPDRVWNGEEGLHPADDRCKKIKIEHCLVRKDGWSLGVPLEHCGSALALWEDEWDTAYAMENGELRQLTTISG